MRSDTGRWNLIRSLFALAVLATSSPLGAETRIAAPTTASHPMDGLTADEIKTSTQILRAAGKLPDGTKIVSISLEESAKTEVRAWTPGTPFKRVAFAVVIMKGRLAEARLDLGARSVAEWTEIDNRQAALTIDEILSVGDLVKSDPKWREAMARRGITRYDNVTCFPLTTGSTTDPALAGRRVLRVPCVDKSGTANNLWGKPIENVMATVDLATGTVLSVIDLGVLAAPPQTPSHAWADSARLRPIPKPVQIAAPGGSNVVVEGGQIRWDKWSFHARFDHRLGTILSLIRYDDAGTVRDIGYQLSASEMFVPYMDPTATWSFRTYMDIGEYGFGVLASQLRPGEDCPTAAHFLDMILADPKGMPVGLKGVVCIFERPTGDPLWRHDEAFAGSFEARVNTELVVRMAPAVGNYDYLVDYVFSRAGDIDVRVGAYGIVEPKGVAADTLAAPSAAADTAYGTLVAPRLVAVNHDHYLAFRLDLDIDGTENRLVEDRLVPRRTSADGPRRSLWQVENHPLATEGPITTPLGAAQFRVESTGRKNALGYPTAYQILPGHAATSILALDDPAQMRAAFTAYTLWATPFAPDEKFAAGAYPNQNTEQDGLAKWVRKKRPVDRKDLVLWYVLGFHHVPRAEDWPAMPGLWHGFRLRPFNFFDRSPALDVPPATATEMPK